MRVGDPSFEQSVFINCPFDERYEPILQAILFCIFYLGLHPRIALESSDSGQVRIEKIVELIEASRFSIHDLSRAQASTEGEFYRLNMPFELGVDYGCRRYSGNRHATKRFLILEERPYRYQASLSDLSGCDIGVHGGNYQTAVRKVRNWLSSEASLANTVDGADRILRRYADFQGWYYERQIHSGFSEEDIQDYATSELMVAMKDWIAAGKPITTPAS